MLPGPTAPSEGFAGVRDLDLSARRPKNPSSILAHQLRRRFPPRRSEDPVPCSVQLPREPRPPIPLRLARRRPRPSMFHGPSWAGSLPRGLVSLGGKPPSYKEAPALPAPLADWSGNPFAASSPRRAVLLRTSFHRLPAEIGPSVTRRTVLPLPAFWGGGEIGRAHV